ncbi:hypothetical protein IEQ34_019005 [Dendrobium chrysotoxum]|uniref:Uncharacterized protein n=1 Tax=Dendrobium chrysotoxum TaxID=161865 RepID=A0AAV7G5P3_DENCH|nr:hypothetical protein IEQ34_019005 [Dendrobium chrysotoxum]
MGDTVQSAFLEAIFQSLLPATIKLLLDELCLPDEVKKELESLTTDVSMLQAYLRDAAQKQQTYEVVRLWLSKLQDVAYDANDLLDECELEGQRQKVIRLARVRNSLSVINPKRSMFLHDISSRVTNMKMKMEDIKKQRHDYGLQPEQERLHINSNQSSSLEPLLILGRDDDKRRIIDLLLRPNVAGESSTIVLCIVGMGGLGKTALAQHVYNDDHVKQSFTLRSWVHVSQDFKEEKLTKDILESIDGPSQNSASLNNLQIDLLNKLRGRKYLIVLDEVWIEDWRKWYKFKIPLLQGAVGSKILVTTRNLEVAKAMGASTIYPLQPMGEQDCWSLFCYYMAQQNPCIDVNDLRGFSGVIAQKCNGLPSAAADLAFRLCQEPNRSRWNSILKTENLQNSDSSRVDLSYQLLPSRLKQCFAFCSLFPDGFEFDKEELINLWMAQNFIQCSNDQRIEDVGSGYFDFLERRSLFQYSRSDRKSNRPKYIIHSSIHNFARYVSKGECIDAKPGQGIGKARHLSLTCQEAGTDLTRDFLSDQLRGIYTLVVFGDSLAVLPDDFIRKLENLRALDLSNTILQKLPNSINHLKHLRCLQLRGTKIRRLPDAIGELYFLQTLGLGNCYMLEKLPKGIKYLQKLRHIDLHWDDDSMLMMDQEDISWSLMGRHSLKFMPPEIGLLIELQTLSRFVVGEKSGCGLEELENLNELRGELLISNLHLVKQSAEATKAKLKAKKHLQCLELHWDAIGEETLNFSQTFQRRDDVERILCELQPHNGLRDLRIVGYMGTSFPTWFGSSYLCNMTSLTLINCRQCFSFPPLGNLPLLTELHIQGMDAVCCVNCEFCVRGNAVPFRALKKLHFESMPILMQWCGDKGCALNALRELVIRNCSMLEKITHDMPSLEKLVIEETPKLVLLPYLQYLRSLEVTRCGDLFWKLSSSLTSLHSLSLRGLSTKYLPAEFQYGSLQRLEINSCNELECFPDNWLPTSLVYLGVKNCPMLHFLPNDINKLKVLEDMEIQSCPRLSSLPEHVGYLKSLVRLDISNCKSLLSLPSSLPNTLHILRISKCPKLEERCKLGGEDWLKIKDIFSLWIDEDVRGDCSSSSRYDINLFNGVLYQSSMF